jgi:hypothetical protein
MFDLKPLSPKAVPRALEKAERYRLLNEPMEAESIAHDVLALDPANQKALIMLLLALTDQFAAGRGDTAEARALLPRLEDTYERSYYAGIICERRAKAHYERSSPGSNFMAYDLFRQAMDCYEEAEALRPPGNDDAVLRWNACARILARDSDLRPAPQEERVELPLE